MTSGIYEQGAKIESTTISHQILSLSHLGSRRDGVLGCRLLEGLWESHDLTDSTVSRLVLNLKSESNTSTHC